MKCLISFNSKNGKKIVDTIENLIVNNSYTMSRVIQHVTTCPVCSPLEIANKYISISGLFCSGTSIDIISRYGKLANEPSLYRTALSLTDEYTLVSVVKDKKHLRRMYERKDTPVSAFDVVIDSVVKYNKILKTYKSLFKTLSSRKTVDSAAKEVGYDFEMVRESGEEWEKTACKNLYAGVLSDVIFEKCRSSGIKKRLTDDDDHDHSSGPMYSVSLVDYDLDVKGILELDHIAISDFIDFLEPHRREPFLDRLFITNFWGSNINPTLTKTLLKMIEDEYSIPSRSRRAILHYIGIKSGKSKMSDDELIKLLKASLICKM